MNRKDIYGVNELYDKMYEIQKEVCSCGCKYDPFKECSVKSRIIADMYEIGLEITKRYERVDKIKEKIIQERIYKALLYAPMLEDDIYFDIFDYDESKLTPCMFITFNPSSRQDFQTCFHAVERYMKLKYIEKGMFVVEQRAEDFLELGKGFHFHILVWHSCPKLSHFRRDAQRVFQSFCDVEKTGCLNFRCNRKDRDIENRKEYILGKKVGEDKEGKQNGDKEFRKIQKIEEYYTFNIPINEIQGGV